MQQLMTLQTRGLTAANNLNIAVLVSSTTRVNVSDDRNQWLISDSSWQIQQLQVIEWVEHKGGKQEVDIASDEQPIQSCQNRCDVLMSASLLDPPGSSHSLLTRTIKQVVDVALSCSAPGDYRWSIVVTSTDCDCTVGCIVHWLWLPYIIGQTIIFSCCGLFFLLLLSFFFLA